jgi:hypothetical protein
MDMKSRAGGVFFGLGLGFILTLALLSCAAVENLVGETGQIDGCMYLKGRVVPPKCLYDLTRAGAVGSAGLAKCVAESNVQASGGSTLFVLLDGELRLMPACYFQDGAQREYYRYDFANSLLYTRLISCDDGCKSLSKTFSLSFAGGFASAVQAAESSE